MASQYPGPYGPKLWVRNPKGDELGLWALHSIVRGLATKTVLDEAELLDTGMSRAVRLPSGAEQLRLRAVNGQEIRITLVDTGDRRTAIIQRIEDPDSSKHPFTDLFAQGTTVPQIEWTTPDKKAGVWSRPDGKPPFVFHRYGYEYPLKGGAIPLLRAELEHVSRAEPQFESRTPNHNTIWFEFSEKGEPDLARLVVYARDLKYVGSVDLLELGGYKSAASARASLNLSTIQSDAGGLGPLRRDDYIRPTPVENLYLEDLTGRTFRITIKDWGKSKSVSAKPAAKPRAGKT